jgi:ornithine carbamoyltransferase
VGGAAREAKYAVEAENAVGYCSCLRALVSIPSISMVDQASRGAALARSKNSFRRRAERRPRSFLSINDLTREEFARLIADGLAYKRDRPRNTPALAGKSIALLFQKTSTRTRCSFENAAWELGAQASYIEWRVSNFDRAALEDETRVLSLYYDAIVARVYEHDTLDVMAAHSEAPIINGLSDRSHPCQVLADFMTLKEYFGGDLDGLQLTYIGDGNNVCRSLIEASAKAGVSMRVCSPNGYEIDQESIAAAGAKVARIADPREAVRGADVVYTDAWISMGDEDEAEERLDKFKPFRVDTRLLSAAPEHALVMHCLPAHVTEEIAEDVLRSDRAIVFDQAENRKHAQKALLAWLIK